MMKAERFEDATLMALKLEKGAFANGERGLKQKNQFLQAGKDIETNSPSSVSGGSAALPAPQFWPSEIDFGLLVTRTVKKKFMQY